MIATNAFKQAVVGTYTASDTVIELNSVSDTVGASDYLPNGGFNLILYDGLFGNPADANNAGKYEILECSSVNYATNEITVVRERENTTAVTIDASSWQVVYGATVAFFAQFEDADATILKQADVVDTLVSTSAIDPLSANQGKQLEDTKQANLVSGTNIKTINSESILGSGDLEVGGGKVLQVVTATHSTAVSTSLGTYQDTGLEGTITPTSASSKILCLISIPYRQSAATDDTFVLFEAIRGSTQLNEFESRHNNIKQLRTILSWGVSDSPATTSAITYKARMQQADGKSTVTAQQSDNLSTMILIEVEA